MKNEIKQEKKVSKKLQEFINSIATIGNSNIPDDDGKIYYSKVDGAFLTRVGMEENLNFLFKRGITEQIQDGYGDKSYLQMGTKFNILMLPVMYLYALIDTKMFHKVAFI